MNIHEQIIAFLDGELRDESQVAELLHVLAVAPEKQRLLIDQVQIRRSFATLGGGLASPLAADAAILQGLHAIDAGFPSPGPQPLPSASAGPSPAAGLFRYSPVLMSSVAILLITVGGVIGYIFGSGAPGSTVGDMQPRDEVAATAQARPGRAASGVPGSTAPSGSMAPSGSIVPGVMGGGRPTSSSTGMIAREATGSTNVSSSPVMRGDGAVDRSTGMVAALRDSLARLRSRYTSLLAANAREARRLADGARPVTVAQSERPLLPRREDGSVTELRSIGSRPEISSVLPRTARDGAHAVTTSGFGVNEMTAPNQMEGRSLTERELSVAERVWQIGMRSNFRISFPRIYGIEPRINALTDREIVLTRRLGAGAMGLQMPMRMGIAVGGTQFSESFHTNTGGRQIDTIIAQTPNFIYGRGFIAPELISTENFGASLELGAGGTIVGPFATLGLGMEYRALDRVSVDVGLSSWLLWTKLEQQAIMSTNLNAHVGAAVWFSFDEMFK